MHFAIIPKKVTGCKGARPVRQGGILTIYLDNAATTAVCPEAAELMAEVMTRRYGNPSSTHAMGREARQLLDEARGRVANAVGAEKQEITFTSGGTESDNWAVFGVCEKVRKPGHIVTSAYEHDAVLEPCRRMEERGWQVTYLSPDREGHITPEMVTEALRPDTALVSVMLVNNEIGAVNDVAAIAAAVRRESGAAVHTDAVQGLLKVPVSVRKLGVDLMSLSGHKVHGPKGIGALYIRNGFRLPPLIRGGGQESARRSGTEAMPAVCGFGEAVRTGAEAMDEAAARMRLLRRRIADGVLAEIPEAMVLGPGDAPHLLSLSLPGHKSEILLNLLDAAGVCVSSGSACKRGRRSHVLQAMGYGPKVIDGALRVSLSRYSTEQEADAFVRALAEAARGVLKKL
ncbi:MAG: cysteine desulfurase [Oscillospiraceae bacterium]|nr:cysteine desulfurase [Oscillospiraceae bacterium]